MIDMTDIFRIKTVNLSLEKIPVCHIWQYYSSTCTFTIILRMLPSPMPGACPSSGK